VGVSKSRNVLPAAFDDNRNEDGTFARGNTAGGTNGNRRGLPTKRQAAKLIDEVRQVVGPVGVNEDALGRVANISTAKAGAQFVLSINLKSRRSVYFASFTNRTKFVQALRALKAAGIRRIRAYR
jgi:hypothetical protein